MPCPILILTLLLLCSNVADVDANYLHSGDFDDEGLIEVIIKIPNNPREAQLFLATLHIELRAALAHEMQHSVQRVIYGYTLDATTKFGPSGSHV